jgi:hypothetical protein
VFFGMPQPREEEQFRDEQVAERRDGVIKRMLNTPPQPHGKGTKQDESKQTRSKHPRGKRPDRTA